MRFKYSSIPKISCVMSDIIKPKFIAFDLDYTLWPFWVDTHVDPPFRIGSDSKIVDSRGLYVNCYHDVPSVLKDLYAQGYIMGIASRTGEIDGAQQLLKLFDWAKYFQYIEIHPGSKVQHFQNIRKRSGIAFKDMVFFDDEERNIADLERVGVVSILVRNGITRKVVQDGLAEFTRRFK